VAQWSILYRYSADKKKPPTARRPAPERIIKITISKNQTTFHEQIHWQSGQTAEQWIYQGRSLGTTPGSAEISANPLSTEADLIDYRRTDFPELTWLSLTHYRGVADFEGKPAYLFTQDLGNGRQRHAWLAPDTQYPLFTTDGEIERHYHYHPTPVPPPTPPAHYLKLFTQWEKHTNQLATPAARP
jgi:hypothetical protein